MRTRRTFNKALFVVTEGQTDATILSSVLDVTGYDKCFYRPANGLHHIVNVTNTLRMMALSCDKILVVLDSDSLVSDTIADKIESIKRQTNADISPVQIGVFCMVPDIETALFGIEKRELKAKYRDLRNALMEYENSIRSKQIIKDIQSFINK